MLTRALIASAALALALSPAQADDVRDAQDVIERQINAFISNDAETAYSFAAPGIQRMYPDPELFLRMVRRSYEPVFKPGNFAFGRSRPAADGSTLVQEVLIAGPDKKDWTAVYVLEKQEDGSFRINGVHMLRSSAPQI
jgi:hypothetical protein